MKTKLLGLLMCMLIVAPLSCSAAIGQSDEQTELSLIAYAEQDPFQDGTVLYLQVENCGDALAIGITTTYGLGPAPFVSYNPHWDGFQYIFFSQTTFCRFLDEGRNFQLYAFLTSADAQGEFLLRASTQAYNAPPVTLTVHVSVHGNCVDIIRISP